MTVSNDCVDEIQVGFMHSEAVTLACCQGIMDFTGCMGHVMTVVPERGL
jgi:hypothetical protein